MSSQEETSREFEAGYGWRARIGHLNPSLVDETVAKQFYRMAPPGVTLVQTSLRVQAVTEEGITAAISRANAAALELAKEEPDNIIIGGSPTAVIGGVGSDVDLAQEIQELTGIPTTSAQAAAIEAMRTLKMRSLAIVTPFGENFNRMLREFLEGSGFSVRRLNSVATEGRGHLKNLERLPLKDEYDCACRTFKEAGEVDGIYFPAAPSPVVDIIERLEQDLGTSVVTSLQATLWKGMHMAGVTIPVEGFGKLLRTQPV